jgi:eukaryotic-like serine/threonine-protein kinase
VDSPRQEVLGRYTLLDEIASGGMATVHYGRLLGDAGFSRTVAVKRLYPQFAKDPEFASMFIDEARLAARIRHPNVVQTLDVVALDGELFLVMEYVLGESLARILKVAGEDGTRLPLDITSAIVCSALHGLHAAHEATSDRGEPLDIVHRDVSPQNILVGADGGVRIIDFGVAKAANRLHTTRDGKIKGKLGYMAPEQLHDKKLDRRADMFSAGVVLWEMLTGERLFQGETDGATLMRVVELTVDPPSKLVPEIPPSLDAVVSKSLQRHPSKRFATAREMARALEASVPVASTTRVAEWLLAVAGDVLDARARTLAQVEERGRATVEGAPAAARELEVSSVSVSTNARPRNRRIRWGSYTMVALVAASVGVLASRWRSSDARPADVPAAVVAVPPTSVVVASGPSAPPAPPTVSSTIVTTPPPVTTHAKSSPHVVKPRGPATAAGPAKPCVPSYVDEAGIKQYRKCP